MKDVINQFIEDKNVAVAGVSRDPQKWGHTLFKALIKKGYHVYPINPGADEIEGVKCYHAVPDLPDTVSNLIITTSPEATLEIIKSAKHSGIRNIWMHQGAGGTGAQSQEAIDFCMENGMGVVYGFCPMMFLPPVGIHKIHLWMKKISGKFPADFHKSN